MEEKSKREQAFCYIYSQEIQKQNNVEQVKLFLDSEQIKDRRTIEYVKEIANGIKENEENITNMISKNLKSGWTIDRISTIDVALLKLAIYEIIYKKVPYKIVINEVVNYAKIYGEENSGSFINGVLASIVKNETISEEENSGI